jgi:hypothetical protein
MFGLTQRARIGLVIAAVATATTAGLFAERVPTAEAALATATAPACYERYVAAPINEKGIECPGNPAIWKSYTFASAGFGYYTETEDLPNGHQEVRLGYKHRDGRVAIAFMDCTPKNCRETYWNGVPFPFDSDAAHH